RRRARRARGRSRDHRVRRDDRANRGRDGGSHRGNRRRADGLRHVQGRRQGDDDHGRPSAREDEGGGLTAAVLTVSDRVSRGEAEDGSGELLEELLRGDGYEVERSVVADERKEIVAALRDLAARVRLILTTGGTGLAPRDVTPEATRDVIEREAPGIAQALRAHLLHHTPDAPPARAPR